MSVLLTEDGQVWSLSMRYSFDGTTQVLGRVDQLQNIMMVDCNGQGGLALDRDGFVWKFSLDPASRQAGTAEKISSISGVKAIAGGGSAPDTTFTLVLKKDGTVWTWGANDLYQLGIGSTISSQVPVQISSLGNNVTAISAGSYQGLALKSDGTVWNWGKVSPYENGTYQQPAFRSGKGAQNRCW